MTLDDRDYKVALGMTQREVDAAIDGTHGRRASRGWMVAAACIGCTFLGYAAGTLMERGAWSVQTPVVHHPMPRVLQ
jgi:hypothetical protein